MTPNDHLKTAASAIQRLSPQDFAQSYKTCTGPKVLIDTRNLDEVACGKLAGAVVIPMDELEHRASSLNREQAVFLYCRSGNRAQIAAEFLKRLGCSDLRVAVNSGFEQLRHEMPSE